MIGAPGDRGWPTAACAAWLIASLGLVALATSGPMFRPGVEPTSIGIALAMVGGLAIGWPLLTASGTTIALVGGQGAIALAIDAATHERTSIEVAVSLAAWLGAIAIAGGSRALVRPRTAGERMAWATLCGITAATIGWFVG